MVMMSLPLQWRHRGRSGGALSLSFARYLFFGASILGSIVLVRFSMLLPLQSGEPSKSNNHPLGDFPSAKVVTTNHSQTHLAGRHALQVEGVAPQIQGANFSANFSQTQLANDNASQSQLSASKDADQHVQADKLSSYSNSSQADKIIKDTNPPSKAPTHSQKQNAYHMEISISPDAYPLGGVAPEFISTTMDWWSLGTEAWGNASVINANLHHPKLMAAAKGLSPFFLRVGGSQADEIIYNFPSLVGKQGIASNTEDVNVNVKVAAECKRNLQKCLTKPRWDEVLDFASSSGGRIVFTIAYVRHTRDGEGNNDQKDWDSSNARQFLEYTVNTVHAKSGTVFGFELGNELRHGGKVKNITRIVNAYKELREMVDEIWGEGERRQYHKPKIMGPASTGKGETAHLAAELGPYLDFLTYHKYHGGGKKPQLFENAHHPSFYSHPVKLSGPGEAVEKYMANNTHPLWIGEGAMAYNSGRQGLTDSFHGSLWFVNLLGALSKTKPVAHSVYCRQAFIGGYYELVSHETLIPNPDYWVAYLWKNIVGTKAIGPIQSPQREDSRKLSSLYTFGCCKKPGGDSVLIHSFCAARSGNGDAVFVVINISESRAINLNVAVGENRTEYLLRPNEDGLRSRQVFLNGQLMSIENSNLPEIRGVLRRRNEEVHVPPISIAFIVVHGAGVKECLS